MFKVKIQKGSLNHKNEIKKEKRKRKVEVKLKTQKGQLDYKGDSWIENPKGRSRKMDI